MGNHLEQAKRLLEAVPRQDDTEVSHTIATTAIASALIALCEELGALNDRLDWLMGDGALNVHWNAYAPLLGE